MFYRVQAFCDLLDSRKEPFGFSIAPFSSAFSECRIDVFREDMEPPVEISLCASRQPALDIIATRKAPFGATSVRGVRGYTSYSMRRAYFWRYAIR